MNNTSKILSFVDYYLREDYSLQYSTYNKFTDLNSYFQAFIDIIIILTLLANKNRTSNIRILIQIHENKIKQECGVNDKYLCLIPA